MRTAMRILHEDLGVVRSEAQLRDDAVAVEDRVAELMAGGVVWRPGARDLLADVRDAGLPTALVTTTPRRLTSIVLAAIAGDLGLDPFDVTVCGDEVPARKPDPAPYLQALRMLGATAARSVVIEDSQAGIAAGLAAGVAVLGVPALQAVAPARGLVLRDGLVGLGVDGLADVLASVQLADRAAS
jgi:HAD superfamily hydrolase (TIGR01509 family)